jgi:isopentenyl-diphosphate delta-isomerase
VRPQIPDGVLLGNIGAVQLPQVPVERVAELARRIEADGMCVHLNPAQELAQPEGDRSFANIADAIGRLNDALDGHVLVKETGAGMAPATLKRLDVLGIRYIDVAGAGGTSWTRVEMHRCPPGAERQVGETFSDWGVPTAVSIVAARRVCAPTTTIIGSGGIRGGLDCAQAIAAGAHVVGFARAALLAWHAGGDAGAREQLARMAHELRVAMLLTGSSDVQALRRSPRIYTGQLARWLESYGWLPDGAAT